MEPPIPMMRSNFNNRLNSSVNTLLISTNVISLDATPKIKHNPPLVPLLMLCLIIEKITGPTDIASNNPKAKPLTMASCMV